MSRPLPTFLVAGAARSGTTGLVEGLRTHPEVFVTSPKEPHYFAFHGQKVDFRAPGDQATINAVAVTDRDAYLSLYDGTERAVARGDGSVSTLFYHRHSIPEISAVNPDMRLVIMLRDPVERAFSSFSYLRVRGFEPEEDFLSAVALERERRAANWHHLWQYTEMSFYADAVGAFLTSFPRGQVGVWFYDDLQVDYEGTVAEVLRFVGTAPAAGEGAGVPRVNTSGTPRSRSAHRLIGVATRNEAIRRAVKSATSYRMREFVRRKTLRPGTVDDAFRAELQPRFEEDLRQLRVTLLEHGHRGPLPGWLAGD